MWRTPKPVPYSVLRSGMTDRRRLGECRHFDFVAIRMAADRLVMLMRGVRSLRVGDVTSARKQATGGHIGGGDRRALRTVVSTNQSMRPTRPIRHDTCHRMR